jgi:hypothetical protein
MFGRLIQALVLAVFTSSALLFAMALGRAAEGPPPAPTPAVFVLLINVGLGPGDVHAVTTGKMPEQVCRDLMSQINLPLIFRRKTTMIARCERHDEK